VALVLWTTLFLVVTSCGAAARYSIAAVAQAVCSGLRLAAQVAECRAAGIRGARVGAKFLHVQLALVWVARTKGTVGCSEMLETTTAAAETVGKGVTLMCTAAAIRAASLRAARVAVFLVEASNWLWLIGETRRAAPRAEMHILMLTTAETVGAKLSEAAKAATCGARRIRVARVSEKYILVMYALVGTARRMGTVRRLEMRR